MHAPPASPTTTATATPSVTHTPTLTHTPTPTAADGTLTATPSLTATPCAAQQQPLAVAVVLDRSGSMRGAPLSAAKTGAHALLDTLDLAIDHFTVISFAGSSRIEAPLSQDRALLRTAIDGIAASGTTNIAAGIATAHAELTRDRRTPGAGQVLVILSDGQGNLAQVRAVNLRCPR